VSFRVLMVDDEESLVWSFERQFAHERPQWTFEGFTDPYRALERIRAQPPDVLVTDIRMPKMSGIELLVAARSVAPALPVAIVTAYGSAEVFEAAAIRTNVECLEKPIRFDSLAEAIDRLRAKPAGFSGAISLQLLPDLLQVYTLSGTSGAMTLAHAGASGTIWFSRGEIIHASCGHLAGAEAVYELLTWPEGQFSFDRLSTSGERTIEINWQALLLEGCRRLDEQQLRAAELGEAVDSFFNEAVAEEAAAGDPADSSESSSHARQAQRLLGFLREDVPGFIAAAVVEPRSGRTLSKLSLRDDFDPAMAALLEGDVALRAGERDAGTRIEDALFTLSDQIHFLHSLGEHQWVYVVTERSDSSHPALVRSAVTRHLRGQLLERS
jgi:CheY-like chemotaxis protein